MANGPGACTFALYSRPVTPVPAWLADQGLPPPPGPPAGTHRDGHDGDDGQADCPVLEWARSGAMWLTGPPDGPPCWPDAPVIATVRAVADVVAAYSAGRSNARQPGTDRSGGVDVAELLTARAADRGLRRHGQVSAGGGCRLLAAADGWVAVSVVRPGDVDAVPAIVGALGQVPTSDDPWTALAAAARSVEAARLADVAQLIGVPAAPVAGWSTAPDGPTAAGGPARPPVVAHRLGSPVPPDPSRPPLVVDLTTMWAGPLCAHLLGRSGARVVKVEDTGRPDGARVGDARLFDRLHAGHESVQLDFRSAAGRAALHALVRASDVVLESARPRALPQLGLHPADLIAQRPGRTWVSVTGYGRDGHRSGWVAFGDDAAAGAGLVAPDRSRRPVFCGDAIADPLAGLFAAAAALASIAAGGGHLVDVSMHHAAAFAAAGPGCPARHHLAPLGHDRWLVTHVDGTDRRTAVAAPPAPSPFPGPPAPPAGADTARVLAELAASDGAAGSGIDR